MKFGRQNCLFYLFIFFSSLPSPLRYKVTLSTKIMTRFRVDVNPGQNSYSLYPASGRCSSTKAVSGGRNYLILRCMNIHTCSLNTQCKSDCQIIKCCFYLQKLAFCNCVAHCWRISASCTLPSRRNHRYSVSENNICTCSETRCKFLKMSRNMKEFKWKDKKKLRLIFSGLKIKDKS